MNARDICARAIATKGGFRDSWVRDAFHTVDRTQFVPNTVWSQTPGPDGRYPIIDHAQQPDAWQHAAWHPHRSVITQLDDHRAPDTPASGTFSSSISAPDTVCELLCQLEVKPGHRVLEIGTGSGYSAALLCHHAGSGNVTTVEVDADLSESGTANLTRAGYHPQTVCGDGMHGWPPGGPYDRIIATAAVRHIPPAWTQQCTPGAVILAPFGTCYASGALLKLTVTADGHAVGGFTGTANYMWVRHERPNRNTQPPDTAWKTASPIDPAQILRGSWTQDFAIGLNVPGIDYAHRGDGDRRQVQLWDQAGTSVTLVSYGGWWEDGAVSAYGPRDLWAEVVAAFTRWRTAGQPDLSRYRVTVDAAGQHVWLDDELLTTLPA